MSPAIQLEIVIAKLAEHSNASRRSDRALRAGERVKSWRLSNIEVAPMGKVSTIGNQNTKEAEAMKSDRHKKMSAKSNLNQFRSLHRSTVAKNALKDIRLCIATAGSLRTKLTSDVSEYDKIGNTG